MSTITRSARAVHRQLQDRGGVILDLETGGYFNLNGVGMVLWAALERPAIFDQLLQEARARFPDAPADLESEVRGFLDELLARGLIEVS